MTNSKASAGIHTAAAGSCGIKLAQNLKFKAISADLIIGLPGQTWTSLRQSLETVVGMGIQQPFGVLFITGRRNIIGKQTTPRLPSHDLQAKLFEETKKYLNLCGYAHYEKY